MELILVGDRFEQELKPLVKSFFQNDPPQVKIEELDEELAWPVVSEGKLLKYGCVIHTGETRFRVAFVKDGVVMMTLTWNGINEIGSGNVSQQGLTPFGKAVIRRMEEAGILEIVQSKNGERRVVPEKFGCDYYDFLDQRSRGSAVFPGSYMTNYSWAENTLANMISETK